MLTPGVCEWLRILKQCSFAVGNKKVGTMCSCLTVAQQNVLAELISAWSGLTQLQCQGFVEERLFVLGEDFPGLCMTRSLGDLCVKQHGISAEPEIVTWNVRHPESCWT